MEDTSVYLSWESTVYPDGGTYEGLSLNGQCQGWGVFRYADNDIYEGNYEEGMMHGLGVYKWSNGSVFKGQWRANMMHGCGRKFYPGGALEEGEWVDDNFVGDYGSCDAAEALATAQDAERAAERAREFSFKPDGDVSYHMGLSLDQEPSIYTAGTEYLMPGSAGNLYKVPNDPAVRRVLLEQARKAGAIYASVNFPKPPADMLAVDAAEDEAQKAIAAAAAPVAAFAEEEDDEEDDEPPAPARPPPRVASLSLSLLHNSCAVSRAFDKVGRALRRRRLGLAL